MTVPSSTLQEEYGWLGQFPQTREWIGERHIKNLTTHGFTIRNRDFESTVTVKRNDLADDRIGIYKPMFQEMGRATKQHPDELVFGLLKNGFATNCYDGQAYFDADHPVYDNNGAAVGSISNMQAGSSPAWFLMDLSKPIKPMIWQEREAYNFESIVDPHDYNVFMKNEFYFGIRARVNVGFGLWHLSYASKAALTIENFVAARTAMTAYSGDHGRLLGITPTHLIVPPSLEEAAREMFKANLAGGESNIWQNAAQLIVTHHVA